MRSKRHRPISKIPYVKYASHFLVVKHSK